MQKRKQSRSGRAHRMYTAGAESAMVGTVTESSNGKASPRTAVRHTQRIVQNTMPQYRHTQLRQRRIGPIRRMPLLKREHSGRCAQRKVYECRSHSIRNLRLSHFEPARALLATQVRSVCRVPGSVALCRLAACDLRRAGPESPLSSPVFPAALHD